MKIFVVSSLMIAFAAASPARAAETAADHEREEPPALTTLPPPLAKPDVPLAKGEVVSAIADSCWWVFQDASDNRWFGSDGQGVFRYDGKTLTNFTTKDGLVHDQVRGIQQHAATGHILITTNDGVSRFDGQRFVTLPIKDMEAPQALGFASQSNASAFQGWVLNAADLWLTGSGGPRRYDGQTLYQLKFAKAPHADEWHAAHPESRWNPYDVWTTYVDRRGHMWFGTGGMGVCRFDGQSLDWMFEPHLTEVPGAGWFGFRSIVEDNEGAFWICNTQYRYKFEPHGAAGQEAGRLKYERMPGMDLAGSATTDKFLYFQSITKDNNGDLWMTPWMGGVWKYDGQKVTHHPMTHGDEQIKMISISTDNQGDIWVATQWRGPYKFNGKAFERFAPPPPAPPVGKIGERRKNDPYFTPTEAKTTSTMPKVIIRNIREDRAGNIWFATFGGPIRYDGRNFTNFADEAGLSTTRIFSVLEDRHDTLWFGSITGGASRFDGNTFRKFTEKDGLAGNDVTWLFEDRDGKIWFGTNNGVSRYDGEAAGTGGTGATFTNFTTKDGLVHNAVYTIGQDATGRIWFGTQGGICSYDGTTFSNFADQVGTTFSNIRAMAVDKSGNLWFGGEGGAYRYDGKTLTTFTSRSGLLEDFVGSIIVDRAGNVWLGHPGAGRQGGASRYDGTSFKHFTQKDGLNSTNVYAMLEDSAGNIWFGSVDAGACRYDGKTFTNFSADTPEMAPVMLKP